MKSLETVSSNFLLVGYRRKIGLRCINRAGRLADGFLGRLPPDACVQAPPVSAEIVLLCVRWYCRYGISYRDLEEMMDERGVAVDHVTLYRWVQRYAPEIEKRVRWYQGYRSSSWRVDETYVRVGGKWKYLFRAVDKRGRLIDFMLSDRRNTKAARRFLPKALKVMRNWPPVSITTDKLASYPKALRRLKREGELNDTVRHRTCTSTTGSRPIMVRSNG